MIESRRVSRCVARLMGDVRPRAEERVVYRAAAEGEREALVAAAMRTREGAYSDGVRLGEATWSVVGAWGVLFHLVRLLPLPSVGPETAWAPPPLTSVHR